MLSVWPDDRPDAGARTAAQAHPNDEELLFGLLDRNASALQALFARYSRLVSTIALHILRDRGEAKEIVQEVFVHIYRKAALFDPGKGVVKAWIVQLAYHRALDRRLYLNRRQFYSGTDVDSLDDTLLEAPDLEREIGAKLSRAQLEKSFKQLPEMQRQTLELYYFEGLKLREISEKLNVSSAGNSHLKTPNGRVARDPGRNETGIARTIRASLPYCEDTPQFRHTACA